MSYIRLSTLFFVVAVSSLSLSFAQQKLAPDFVISNAELPSKLSELKGQVVYLDFWASWCKPCRKSFPWMNQMQQKYADRGLQVIAINLDTDAALAKLFLEKVPTQIPIVYDPEGNIASDYQLLGMPSSYLVDKKGNIRFSHKGFFSRNKPLYEQELVLLLNE
ncbi:TlpA disulfide reductase family protein [Paraglaciecola arctica]|uniref:TlpA disulfide reductase family protein n=1 Tax=Paraglaciecola arctica TaxID=1128911 RepID=UPI001C073B32|nr:TlpA disulfide reductase family protein [Paraglaciecola arctica]MBU3006243.1 TlpA family protein disulfide reductase [Paraglaciecola arctica]